MTNERKYVVLVGSAGVAALLAWYLSRRTADAATAAPMVLNDDGALEEITVTAQRLELPTMTADTPRGVRNHNPGNLVWLPADRAYNGQLPDPDGQLARYVSAFFGIRAAALELKNDYERKGLRTIDALITEWAPPHENPTVAYINHVSRAMNFPTNRTLALNRQTWLKLMRAIFRMENGGDFYTDAQILEGIAAAGVSA